MNVQRLCKISNKSSPKLAGLPPRAELEELLADDGQIPVGIEQRGRPGLMRRRHVAPHRERAEGEL